MRRPVLIVLAALVLAAWGAVFFLTTRSLQSKTIIIPTLMVLPSVTPTDGITPSALPTHPPSAALPVAATESISPTLAPSATPTLSERLLVVTAIMPGVPIQPTATSIAPDTELLSAPPYPVEPLVDATNSAPPFLGWYSFESDYPTIRYDPPWMVRLAQAASRGQYHRTEAIDATASFAFEGEGLRIRYVAATNMGSFQIVVDGVVLDTIDAYADRLTFLGTRVYFVGSGPHRLQIRASEGKQAGSEGTVVGLDAIEVYRADGHTRILPPVEHAPTPTPTPQEVARITLISAPPTLQPTGTPIPPRIVTASVLVAYDENSNHAVDPAEGVAGISVRVVDITTNRVIASGFTDETGYVQLAIVMDTPLQVVVPYFGQTWTLQNGNPAPAFTLLLAPGNQPGLIP